jgi:hypothetical protein
VGLRGCECGGDFIELMFWRRQGDSKCNNKCNGNGECNGDGKIQKQKQNTKAKAKAKYGGSSLRSE